MNRVFFTRTVLSIFSISFLIACGQGATSNDPTLVSTEAIEKGNADCPAGGYLIKTGVDRNKNDVLDTDEVVGTPSRICEKTTNLTLFTTETIEKGNTDCPNGGFLVKSGVDKNKNNVLDADEITGTPKRICDNPSDQATEKAVSEATLKLEMFGPSSNPSRLGEYVGSGSGFLISNNGLLVTNNHVVANGDRIIALNAFNEAIGEATFKGVAECADLAVLQLQPLPGKTIPTAFLQWSDQPILRGANIATGGYPGDLLDASSFSRFSYTKGSVTSSSLYLPTTLNATDTFTHDAQMYRGNSGGPVIDLSNGKVIGINTIIQPSYETDVSLPRYYAISYNKAKELTERMARGENISAIGISGEVFLDSYANLPKGIYVKAVRQNSHSSRIGLSAGDLITSVKGATLNVSYDINYSSAANRAKYTMEHYCSVLAQNSPNNVNSANDTGAVLPIKVLRTTFRGSLCTGEINGSNLTCSNVDAEPNNTTADANNLVIGGTVNGVIQPLRYISGANGGYTTEPEMDLFKFTITTAGNYRINLSSKQLLDVDLYVFDPTRTNPNGEPTQIAVSDSTGFVDESVTHNFTAPGTYYVRVNAYTPKGYAVYPAEYSISLNPQ